MNGSVALKAGGTGNYFSGAWEHAHTFGDLGRLLMDGNTFQGLW